MKLPSFAVPSAVLPAAVLAGALVAGLVPGTAAPAHAGATNVSYSAAGLSSTYHLYDGGIDRSKPVGAVFYFDGDGQYYAQRPTTTMLKTMAARAAAKNMILVVPVSPTTDRTWYSRSDANGDWFRALAAKVIAEQKIDTTRIHLAGYSGGAEFIAAEVLSDRAGWIRGGGATIIGGGGVYYGGLQTAPDAALKATDPTWYVGSNDGVGATQPASWSALDAAAKGAAAYQKAGFTKADRVVLPGLHHTNYDLADLVGDDVDRLYSASIALTPAAPSEPVQESGPVNGYELTGAIGSKWAALGGTGWATPTSAEWASGYGSVYQRFAGVDGKDKAIYWSKTTGTRVVNYGGAIGQKFAAAGYAGTYGPPSTEERTLSGGAYQVFNASGRSTKVLWSPGNGARAVKEYGAIGKKWQSLGAERGLGFPTTDEYSTATGAAQKFTGGRIEWRTGGGTIVVRG